jgi:hypothetical protein
LVVRQSTVEATRQPAAMPVVRQSQRPEARHAAVLLPVARPRAAVRHFRLAASRFVAVASRRRAEVPSTAAAQRVAAAEVVAVEVVAAVLPRH